MEDGFLITEPGHGKDEKENLARLKVYEVGIIETKTHALIVVEPQGTNEVISGPLREEMKRRLYHIYDDVGIARKVAYDKAQRLALSLGKERGLAVRISCPQI